MAGKNSRKTAPKRRLATPIEERYGAIPTELSGIDRQELPAGDEADQVAAHGPEGDAAIPTVGADAEGLTLEEPLAAEEVRHEEEDPD